MRTSIVESIRQLGRGRNADVRPVQRAAFRSLVPSSRVGGICAVVALTALTGCSIHPLVDDVSPIPTEAIVAAARCELRLGLVHQVEVWFADEPDATLARWPGWFLILQRVKRCSHGQLVRWLRHP